MGRSERNFLSRGLPERSGVNASANRVSITGLGWIGSTALGHGPARSRFPRVIWATGPPMSRVDSFRPVFSFVGHVSYVPELSLSRRIVRSDVGNVGNARHAHVPSSAKPCCLRWCGL